MGGNSIPKKRGMLRHLMRSMKGMQRAEEKEVQPRTPPKRVRYKVNGVKYWVVEEEEGS